MKTCQIANFYNVLFCIFSSSSVNALSLFGWNRKQAFTEQIVDAQGTSVLVAPEGEQLSSVATLDSEFRPRHHPRVIDIPGERTVLCFRKFFILSYVALIDGMRGQVSFVVWETTGLLLG
jgi:hypothetical protein